jgi:DNA-binding CsgD family transcriptional regulator
MTREPSPRQTEALYYISKGLTAAEMAEKMGCTERTAKLHCDMLRYKFRVEHRRELIPIGQEWFRDRETP